MPPLGPGHPRVKELARLHQGRHRRTLGLTLVEGVHGTLDALDALPRAAHPASPSTGTPSVDASAVPAALPKTATPLSVSVPATASFSANGPVGNAGVASTPTGLALVELLVAPRATRRPEWPVLEARAEALGLRVTGLSDAAYDRISGLSDAEGVATVLALPSPDGDAAVFHRLWHAPDARLLVAVGVMDPLNAGALVRVAEAAGATGAVFAGGADPRHPKFLRASMGSAFRLPCPACAVEALAARWRADTEDGVDASSPARFAADARGAAPMETVDWRPPMALLVGGEGGGVPPAFLDAPARTVSIPMAGRAESLNVAVAAGVLLYAARRFW